MKRVVSTPQDSQERRSVLFGVHVPGDGDVVDTLVGAGIKYSCLKAQAPKARACQAAQTGWKTQTKL